MRTTRPRHRPLARVLTAAAVLAAGAMITAEVPPQRAQA